MVDSAIYKKVEQTIEELRPFFNADGGDVSLTEISNDFVVKVSLSGNCSSCNMKESSLKIGLEQAIKNAVPEIKEVVEFNPTEIIL